MSCQQESKSPTFSHCQWLFYYDCCFPFSLISQWLTLSREERNLDKREFSFSVSRNQETYYFRWQSFINAQALRSRILSMDPFPNKIDIGAVYNIPIRGKDSCPPGKFKPMEKEFVIDIDMNDYDDIRTCCKGKTLCCNCWVFLAVAADVLEQALRDDFGFKYIFWVFSGRRGIHGWICDSTARALPSDARAAIVDYLNLATASTSQLKKVRLFGNVPHPFVQRSYQICLPYFEKLLKEQKFFERGSSLVKTVDDFMAGARANVREGYFHKKATFWNGTSQHLWEIVLECCLPRDKITPIELVLSLCYPRLDANVSKEMTHLLKMPFCIHEATGKICVPIPRDQLKTFDPSSVPTLPELEIQYKKGVAVNTIANHLNDICVEGALEKTSLHMYLEYFSKGVIKPLLESVTESSRNHPESLEHDNENDADLEALLRDYANPRNDICLEPVSHSGIPHFNGSKKYEW